MLVPGFGKTLFELRLLTFNNLVQLGIASNADNAAYILPLAPADQPLAVKPESPRTMMRACGQDCCRRTTSSSLITAAACPRKSF
jgi:hypothetical protein